MDQAATAEEELHDRGLWTIPNLISLLRLLAVPWFLWLLLHEDRPIAAGILLAILGATDWIDGYIARHFDQGSKIGKVLDPVADRVLLIAGAVALLIDGSAPRWVLIVVLAREAAISIGTLWLAAKGARHIDVQWVGKAGTLALMFALPMFLWLDDTPPGAGRRVVEPEEHRQCEHQCQGARFPDPLHIDVAGALGGEPQRADADGRFARQDHDQDPPGGAAVDEQRDRARD